MQMESQIPTPTIWLPATNFNHPHHHHHHFQQLVHVDDVTKHRFLQPYIPTTTQPVLLPGPHGTHGHFVVQQILHQPFLSATNHGAADVSCGAATATAPTITPAANAGAAGAEHLFATGGGGESNLMFSRAFQPAPTPLLISQHGFNAKLSQQQTLEINLNDVLTHKTIASKSQRKKKVSPSAKRRSRKRLMAFLEAKRKKDCPTITEEAAGISITTTTTTTTTEDKQHLLIPSSTENNAAPPSGDHKALMMVTALCEVDHSPPLSASSPVTSSSIGHETEDKDGGLL